MKLLGLLLAVVAAFSRSASAAANPNFLQEMTPGSQARRGIAYNDPRYTGLFFEGQSRINWIYNWQSTDAQIESRYEYIPMLRTIGDESTGSWLDRIQRSANVILKNPTHVLGFNEPDICQNGGGGSCIAVEDAVTAWKKFMDPAKKFKDLMYLGSPAVSNSEGVGEGLAWLKTFMDKCDDCDIDFICVHWYGQAKDAEKFKQHVVSARKIAQGRPIWVTEFYADGTDDEQKLFLDSVLPWMDSSLDIHRYAYFMAAPGFLVLTNGTALSSVGTHFNTLDTIQAAKDAKDKASGSGKQPKRDVEFAVLQRAQSDASPSGESDKPAASIIQVPECEKGKCAICNNKFCTCQPCDGGKKFRHAQRSLPVSNSAQSDAPAPKAPQTSGNFTMSPAACQRGWCYTCAHTFCACQPCKNKEGRRSVHKPLAPAPLLKRQFNDSTSPELAPDDSGKHKGCKCCAGPDWHRICFPCVCEDKGVGRSHRIRLGVGMKPVPGNMTAVPETLTAVSETSTPVTDKSVSAPIEKRKTPADPTDPNNLNARQFCRCCNKGLCWTCACKKPLPIGTPVPTPQATSSPTPLPPTLALGPNHMRHLAKRKKCHCCPKMFVKCYACQCGKEGARPGKAGGRAGMREFGAVETGNFGKIPDPEEMSGKECRFAGWGWVCPEGVEGLVVEEGVGGKDGEALKNGAEGQVGDGINDFAGTVPDAVLPREAKDNVEKSNSDTTRHSILELGPNAQADITKRKKCQCRHPGKEREVYECECKYGRKD